ncbi:MAG: DsbA family protein [Terriglobia bacterium]
MARVGSILLVLALLLAVTWASRQPGSSASPHALNDRWLEAHNDNLARVLNLLPGSELKIKTVEESVHPDFSEVVFQVRLGIEREAIELTISHDGRWLVYESRLVDLRDPFGVIREKIQLENTPARGPADAPVTIVEYSDYTCSYCRHFFLTQEEEVFERFGDKVRLVYKHYPLIGMRAWSQEAALAASCAYRQSNEAFWRYHPLLFQKAERLKEGEEALVALAAEAALDLPAFQQCLEQRDSLPEVARDLAEGERLGVNGTPNFFVNGRAVMGLVTPQFFFHIIEQELAAAGAVADAD